MRIATAQLHTFRHNDNAHIMLGCTYIYSSSMPPAANYICNIGIMGIMQEHARSAYIGIVRLLADARAVLRYAHSSNNSRKYCARLVFTYYTDTPKVRAYYNNPSH
jgi:hypothetical protein